MRRRRTVRCDRHLLGCTLVALLWVGPPQARAQGDRPLEDLDPETHSKHQVFGDSVFVPPPIIVRAPHPRIETILERLPGQVTVVDLAPLREQLTTTAEVLETVPGVHVNTYGGLGDFSTVSIRGSSAAQVSIYLDGVPLSRAGLGVLDLSSLPFASLERIEIYRGFAPAQFPGARLGGSIHLVTRSNGSHRPTQDPSPRHAVTANAGSFDTRRLGASYEFDVLGLRGFLVSDVLESQGDFLFRDDIGTFLTPEDDRIVSRQNNWLHASELLAKLSRPLPGGGDLQLANHWLRRRRGVPGLPHDQSTETRLASSHNVTHLRAHWPELAGGRLQVQGRVYHDWRRDDFWDRDEVGLGYQDKRDRSRALGAHLGLHLFGPAVARWTEPLESSLHLELRRETFHPWNGFSRPPEGPEQRRKSIEVGWSNQILLLGRLGLHAGLRIARQHDHFEGDLRTPYSSRSATSGSHAYLEPQFGAHLRIWRNLVAETSTGRYHRAPGFLELFGDGGSVAGSSDLVAEEGTNRDYGLRIEESLARIRFRFEFVHFRNRADHLITFVPQSQRVFVARNIGSTWVHGEEWIGSFAPSENGRWTLQCNYTRQRSRDLGIDNTLYTDKTLPLRPARKLFLRLAVRLFVVRIGYEYDHLGQNFLDRWNRNLVERRDLHAIDLRGGWRGFSMGFGIRNLTDDRATDVAGFPLPGRTFFATSGYRF